MIAEQTNQLIVEKLFGKKDLFQAYREARWLGWRGKYLGENYTDLYLSIRTFYVRGGRDVVSGI